MNLKRYPGVENLVNFEKEVSSLNHVAQLFPSMEVSNSMNGWECVISAWFLFVYWSIACTG